MACVGVRLTAQLGDFLAVCRSCRWLGVRMGRDQLIVTSALQNDFSEVDLLDARKCPDVGEGQGDFLC